MRIRSRILVSAFLLGTAVSVPAAAQYMYLDSNGDGAHTAADTFRGSGTTAFDVYLRTDTNRDGSAAVCRVDPVETVTINSYEFCLHADGGQVAWSGFVNRAPTMGIQFGVASSSDDFYAGYGGATQNPPGVYRLASLAATPTSGSPSLQIVPEAPVLAGQLPTPPVTQFGSACIGFDFNNTLRLTSDWFDVDGLAFDMTPQPNQPPILAPVPAVNAAVGDRLWQALQATDADAQPLHFSLLSGPAYAEVTTEEQGTGTAAGRLHVTPTKGETGPAMARVAVTDGAATAEQAISIQVTGAPNHEPRFDLPSRLILVAGGIRSLPLWGYDVDGDDIAFALDAGPDFASVTTRAAHPGGASGQLRIAPSLCEPGSFDATVSLGDGVARSTRTIHIEIRATQPPPTTPDLLLLTREYPGGIAGGDLDGDGLMDIVVANEMGRSISVFRALGGGAFAPEVTYPAGFLASSVALADFDEDGRLDAAVAARAPANVQVLRGRGDGSFEGGAVYSTDARPEVVIAADVTQDGHLDLVVANGGSNTVSVLPGVGDGTFLPRLTARVEGPPYGVAAGDWDGDGRLDLVTADSFLGNVSFLRGFGDGTYRAALDMPFTDAAFSVAAGDWDRDGNLDAAITNYSGSVLILRGDGTGAFTLREEHGGLTNPMTLTAGDVNLDGVDDLVVADVLGKLAQILLGRGDGTFSDGGQIPLPRGAWGAAIGDMNGDGVPDLALSDSEYGGVVVHFASRPPSVGGAARAFVQGGKRPVIASAGGGAYCIRLQPVDNAFALEDLDLDSFELVSEGTGSVDRIAAIRGKDSMVADRDNDGVPEISVCFGQADLGRLVDAVTGVRTIEFRLEGSLLSGAGFCTPVRLEVRGAPQGPLQASVAPNPLNPTGTIAFRTTRPGPLRVRIYDLAGRLVAVPLDRDRAEAGRHAVPIDGRARGGAELASGVYFYRVESADGTTQGRFTILR